MAYFPLPASESVGCLPGQKVAWVSPSPEQSTLAPASHRAARQLEILALRSLELADRVAAGQLAFIEAVDLAYTAAVWADLPQSIDKSGLITGTITGDDIVQATIAAAFANARGPA
jgi:hypothetical protein